MDGTALPHERTSGDCWQLGMNWICEASTLQALQEKYVAWANGTCMNRPADIAVLSGENWRTVDDPGRYAACLYT